MQQYIIKILKSFLIHSKTSETIIDFQKLTSLIEESLKTLPKPKNTLPITRVSLIMTKH